MALPRKHRHWADEEKRSICLQTRAPGVSVAQVARRYAMNANLIFKWLKDPRYVPDDVVGDDPVFLPVEISPETSLAAPLKNDGPVTTCVGHRDRVEIILPDGIRLKVEGGFDGGALACLIKGLRQ
jgi:transposase